MHNVISEALKPAPSVGRPGPLATAYLDTDAAAAYLGLKKHRLQDLRYRGGGPRFTKLGRLVRYRQEWLDEWAEAGVCQTTAEARQLAVA